MVSAGYFQPHYTKVQFLSELLPSLRQTFQVLMNTGHTPGRPVGPFRYENLSDLLGVAVELSGVFHPPRFLNTLPSAVLV